VIAHGTLAPVNGQATLLRTTIPDDVEQLLQAAVQTPA